MATKSFNLRKFFNRFYDNKPNMAILVSLIAAAFIGLSGIFVRLSEVGPVSTAMFRFFFAIPFLWTWMMFDNVKIKDPVMPATPRDYVLLGLSGLFFALDLTTWNIALTMTTVLNATLMNSMTPIFVAFFAWFVLKEKPTVYLLMGILMAVVGSSVLVGQSFQFGLDTVMGDLIGLLSAVFYAGFIVVAKNLRDKFTAATVMAWSSLFTFYFLAMFIPFEGSNILPSAFTGWLVLIGYALIVHVIGQGMMNYSIRHLTAGFTSVTMMLGPIVAGIVAWFLFDEALSLIQMMGAFIVLVGIVVARHSSHEEVTDQKETMNQT